MLDEVVQVIDGRDPYVVANIVECERPGNPVTLEFAKCECGPAAPIRLYRGARQCGRCGVVHRYQTETAA